MSHIYKKYKPIPKKNIPKRVLLPNIGSFLLSIPSCGHTSCDPNLSHKGKIEHIVHDKQHKQYKQLLPSFLQHNKEDIRIASTAIYYLDQDPHIGFIKIASPNHNAARGLLFYLPTALSKDATIYIGKEGLTLYNKEKNIAHIKTSILLEGTLLDLIAKQARPVCADGSPDTAIALSSLPKCIHIHKEPALSETYQKTTNNNHLTHTYKLSTEIKDIAEAGFIFIQKTTSSYAPLIKMLLTKNLPTKEPIRVDEAYLLYPAAVTDHTVTLSEENHDTNLSAYDAIYGYIKTGNQYHLLPLDTPPSDATTEHNHNSTTSAPSMLSPQTISAIPTAPPSPPSNSSIPAVPEEDHSQNKLQKSSLPLPSLAEEEEEDKIIFLSDPFCEALQQVNARKRASIIYPESYLGDPSLSSLSPSAELSSSSIGQLVAQRNDVSNSSSTIPTPQGAGAPPPPPPPPLCKPSLSEETSTKRNASSFTDAIKEVKLKQTSITPSQPAGRDALLADIKGPHKLKKVAVKNEKGEIISLKKTTESGAKSVAVIDSKKTTKSQAKSRGTIDNDMPAKERGRSTTCPTPVLQILHKEMPKRRSNVDPSSSESESENNNNERDSSEWD